MDTFSLFDALPQTPAASAAPVPVPPAGPPPHAAAPVEVDALHPALWRAHQVGRQPQRTWPSGFAALDAELPGAGWPVGALTELLLPHPGIGEMRLLAPVLAAAQQRQRCVMLFDPPAAPCGWALGALGVDVRQLVLIQGGAALGQGGAAPGQGNAALVQGSAALAQGGAAPGQDRALLQPLPLRRPARGPRPGAPAAHAASHTLWALEQALKSGHVGALLAWLPPRLPADALRRLQLAAQAHDGPAFVLRDVQAAVQPSAAPLRLRLAPAGPDQLALQVIKRRGPPLLQPLRLALPPVLSAPAQRRALHQAVPGLAAGEGAAIDAAAAASEVR